MILPSYYNHEGLPNPEYMNDLYALVGIPERLWQGDPFVPEDMNRIYRALGLPELAIAGRDWKDDREIIEGLLRARGLIESEENHHGD